MDKGCCMTQEGREGWGEQKWGHSAPADTMARKRSEEPEMSCSRPKVLARLPDLDVSELDRVIESGQAPSRMRRASQRVSTAILIGVGVLFFVVAIQPFLGGNKDWKPENPAPEAPVAPTWNTSLAQNPGSDDASAKLPPTQIPALPESISSPSIPPIPASIQGPASGTSPAVPTPPSTPNSTPLPWNSQGQQSSAVPAPTTYPVTGQASYLGPATSVAPGSPTSAGATAYVASRPETQWNSSPLPGNGVAYPSTAASSTNRFEAIPTSGTSMPASGSTTNRAMVLGAQPTWSSTHTGIQPATSIQPATGVQPVAGIQPATTMTPNASAAIPTDRAYWPSQPPANSQTAVTTGSFTPGMASSYTPGTTGTYTPGTANGFAPAATGNSLPATGNTYTPGSTGSYPPGATSGFAPMATRGYTPGPTNGYAPAATNGYAPAATNGYAPVATNGYAPAGTTGYAPTATNGYASSTNGYMPAASPMNGYAPAAANGYAPAATNGYAPAATGGYTPVASSGYAPSAGVPTTVQPNAYPSSTEPGVARLQGVIEKSSSRSNDDSPRSSLY